MDVKDSPAIDRLQITPSGYRTLVSHTKDLFHLAGRFLMSNDLIWKASSNTLVRGGQFLCAMRAAVENDRIVRSDPQLYRKLEPHIVLSGPFEGLNYVGTQAFCSSHYPKLLGTYEHEIEARVRQAIEDSFPVIVDVGAADGYYAVGLALKCPAAHVIAFEQNPRAHRQLENLAKVNGVSDRLEIRGRCDPHDLLSLPYAGGFMIMDCEGYEEILLTEEVISHLRHWDFLIETHDGYSREMTRRLSGRFAATHHVEVIEAVHDLNRADRIDVPALQSLNRKQKDQILSEGRQHACLRWMACSSKS